jgi:hypothetical protein
MAAEVASQLSAADVDEYGNIIKNGYLSVVPNTTNKKAWQYQETTTAPVDLPSLTETRPAYRGWTTNYMQYYTELQPNGYGQNPGNPTMFGYSQGQPGPLWSGLSTTNLKMVSQPGDLNNGTFTNAPVVGGDGTATVSFIVVDGKITQLISTPFDNPGNGFTIGSNATVLPDPTPGKWGGSGPIVGIVTALAPQDDPNASPGGLPQWNQVNRRFNQLAVDNVSTPQYQNNPAVIQYSFIHPIATKGQGTYLDPVSVAPPIGNLNL